MKSSISVRTLQATIYSEKHASVDFHVRGDEARVHGNHFPVDTKAVRTSSPRADEFFSLTVGLEHDSATLYLDRETLKGVAFAAQELLDQAEGITDGAEGVHVIGLPLEKLHPHEENNE
jgi:hypothetical protein